MKRFSLLFFPILFFINISIVAQNSIQLLIIGDISSIDLGAIYMSNGLNGQPRFFQLLMNTQPNGKKVFLEGKIDWKENINSEFKELASFKTNIFTSRNLFSDELGNNEIKFEKLEGDKELFKKMAEIGKPSGFLSISISMFSENGEFLDDDYQEIIFSNPSSTLTIISPANESEVDLGNVICSWTYINGVVSYKISANNLSNENQSLDDALNSGNLIIDDFDVGNVTSINLSQINKNREWIAGQKIVVVVKAVYNESGSLQEIKSEPVVFTLKGIPVQPDINLLSLVESSSSLFPSTLVEKIRNGLIQLDQIEIKDSEGNVISFEELKKIISYLELNKNLIINISFQEK